MWGTVLADWSRLEPSPGRYRWGELDREVRDVRRAGLRVLLAIANTPRWATLTPDAPEEVWRHEPPRHLAAWTAFLGALVARYRAHVAAWLVEPSLAMADFRGTTADYMGLLRSARQEVRRLSPGALVVAAAPPGLDLPYLATLVRRAGSDFDAVLLWPRDRSPGDVMEALSVARSRGAIDGRHEVWVALAPLAGRPARPVPAETEVQMTVAARAAGAAAVLWPADAVTQVAALAPALRDAAFVGPLSRGPGVAALVFQDARGPFAVLWSAGGPRRVALEGGVSVEAGEHPLVVRGLPSDLVEEASREARTGPLRIPRDPADDYSRAEEVSAVLGPTNVERGLYNQRFRVIPSGAVRPVEVDGVEAVRTDQARDAVYLYFDVDHSFAYYVAGQWDILVTVVVHRASAPHRVGFDLFYDSTRGYRFTPWQWVEPGDGWVSYTVRLTDAAFCSTWGWDFAVNGAGNRAEELVVREVTVRKVPAGAPAETR